MINDGMKKLFFILFCLSSLSLSDEKGIHEKRNYGSSVDSVTTLRVGVTSGFFRVRI